MHQPYANGLNRNIVQCLHDYDIPLTLSHTVIEIHGTHRVEKVTAPVDETCDRSLPKGGIYLVIRCFGHRTIPETEFRQLAIRIDRVTNGPVVSSTMETSMPGVFACGNVVHIHDLVDFVTEESLLAGRNAGTYAIKGQLSKDTIALVPGEGISYCVPHTISPDREHTIYLRVRRPQERCSIVLGDLYERRLRYAFPAEMIRLQIKPEHLQGFEGTRLPVELRVP